MSGTATELGAYDSGSACRGADEAYHGTLYKQAAGQMRESDEQGGHQGKHAHLYQQ